MEIPSQYIKNLYKVFFTFLVILSLFFAVRLLSELRAYGKMGSQGANTITLSGHGEVQAVPDIASIYFSINKTAKTSKEALAQVATLEKKALEYLKTKNIEDKDIKTENASFYPKYDYSRVPCPSIGIGAPEAVYDCGDRKQTLVGYEASESITVKIRKIEDAGAIIQGLGTIGVSNISGPNYTVDNEDALKAAARKEAIDDAREKAEALAKDLSVRLGKVAGFSESGGIYPMMYAEKAVMGSVSDSSSPAELPKGENTISSDVTITYEIR